MLAGWYLITSLASNSMAWGIPTGTVRDVRPSPCPGASLSCDHPILSDIDANYDDFTLHLRLFTAASIGKLSQESKENLAHLFSNIYFLLNSVWTIPELLAMLSSFCIFCQMTWTNCSNLFAIKSRKTEWTRHVRHHRFTKLLFTKINLQTLFSRWYIVLFDSWVLKIQVKKRGIPLF